MDASRLVPAVGAAVGLLLTVVVFVPFAVVTGTGTTLSSYYSAGPVGLSGVGFLGLLAVVVFAAGRDGATPAETAAGIAAAVGVAALALAAVWALGVNETLLFSFPSEYAWIEYHRLAVPPIAAAVVVVAGWYARVTAGG